MEAGTHCPICFGEYTTDRAHRATAMKCGHLVGFECIMKWIKERGSCPICSAPCRKTHLRQIYAAKVEAIDKEKEKDIIDKYIRETEIRKGLEAEITQLKTQIELIKISARENQARQLQSLHKIHMNFLRYCKIHFFPDNSIVEFDPINQSVIISCYKNGGFGIFKYSVCDFSVNSFIKTDEMVRSLQMSPFNDGICLVAYGKVVLLVNIYTENPIKTMHFDTPVSAVSFSRLHRNLIFVGDMSGSLHMCDLKSGTVNSTKICSENIHSVVECANMLCVASVFGLYGTQNAKSISFEKIVFDIPGICCNLTSDGRNILAVFRCTDSNIACALLGEKNLLFTPDVKQINRHRDKIFNGYIFLSDDVKNTIKVLDMNSQCMVHSYSFKEPAVDFSGDSKTLMVLTKRGAYIYGS